MNFSSFLLVAILAVMVSFTMAAQVKVLNVKEVKNDADAALPETEVNRAFVKSQKKNGAYQ